MTVGLSERGPILTDPQALRLTPADANSLPPLLGGLGWGAPPGAVDGVAAMPAVPLGPPAIDAWVAAGPVRSGIHGRAHWRDDGHWMFGRLDVEAGDAPLTEPARAAYLELFDTLRHVGCPHLLRLWNYVPRINEVTHGLERYRQFNVGRQQAFIEASRDAFEGAPAACAVGAGADTLAIRFLAARTPALPVENPRQVSAYRYSAAHGPRSPTFSRAALADAGTGRIALFVSGTASIVGEDSLHPGDPQAQLAETLRNLEAVIEAAGRRCSTRFALADFHWVAYLRDPAQQGAIRAGLEAWAGPVVVVRSDICRAELLVEIEGHAFAHGALIR